MNFWKRQSKSSRPRQRNLLAKRVVMDESGILAPVAQLDARPTFNSESGHRVLPAVEVPNDLVMTKIAGAIDASRLRGTSTPAPPILLTGSTGTGKSLILEKAFTLASAAGMKVLHHDAQTEREIIDPLHALTIPLARSVGISLGRKRMNSVDIENYFALAVSKLIKDPQLTAPTGIVVAISNFDLVPQDDARRTLEWIAKLQDRSKLGALPVLVIVSGPNYCTEIVHKLAPRDGIWSRFSLENWTAAEAATVIHRTAAKGEIEIEQDAVRILAHESNGNPWRVQRLGELCCALSGSGPITKSVVNVAINEYRAECSRRNAVAIDGLSKHVKDVLDIVGDHFGFPISETELAHTIANGSETRAAELISRGLVGQRINGLVAKRLVDRDPSMTGYIIVAPGLDDEIYSRDLNGGVPR